MGDQQLATQRLQNTEAADALEDDDDESDGDLEALRDFQRAREMTADAKAPAGGNIDALALQASMDGPDVVRAPVQRKAPKKRRETTGESQGDRLKRSRRSPFRRRNSVFLNVVHFWRLLTAVTAKFRLVAGSLLSVLFSTLWYLVAVPEVLPHIVTRARQ